MKEISAVFMLLCMFFLSGCSMKMAKFSIVSTKDVDFSNAKMKMLKDGVVGVNKCRTVFGFPLDDCMPKIDLAVSDALEKSHSDVLKNVDAIYKWWDVLFYGEYFIKVTGDAYSVSSSTGNTLK